MPNVSSLDQLPGSLTRRQLLALGLAGTSLAALAGLPNALRQQPMPRIALLSTSTGPAASAFATGLQLAYATQALEQHTVAATPHSLRRTAEQLWANGTVAIVLFANPSLAQWLVSSAESAQRPLIIASSGERLARPEDQHPLLFRASLGAWQAAWGMGYSAVARFGPRLAVLSDLFRVGFDLGSAFRQGAEAAGGQVVFNEFFNTPTELAALAQPLAQSGANALFVDVGQAAAAPAVALAGGLPTITIAAAAGATMNAPLWDRSAPASQALAAASGAASPYSALGYDVGLALAQQSDLRGRALAAALQSSALVGVRGALQPVWGEWQSPLHAELAGGNIALPSPALEAFCCANAAQSPRSGWWEMLAL